MKLFRVRVLNQMSFPYTNLQVSVGLSGGLQIGDTQDATQTVKKLHPEEKIGIFYEYTLSRGVKGWKVPALL